MRTALICVALLLVSRSAAAIPILIDGVNHDIPGLDHAPSMWVASDVGWEWTPTFDFELTSLSTAFRFVDGAPRRPVTAEIYDARPDLGGGLLRSITIDSPAFPFFGVHWGPFPGGPLSVLAGESYFVGFRNVDGMGVNVTDTDPRAETLGPLFYSFDRTGLYDHVSAPDAVPGINHGAPFLFFITDDGTDPPPIPSIPEPALLALLSVGAVAAACRTRKPRNNR